MGAPAELHDLVERCDRNLNACKSGDYDKRQARDDFIDLLLGLLGCNVRNCQGKSPASLG